MRAKSWTDLYFADSNANSCKTIFYLAESGDIFIKSGSHRSFLEKELKIMVHAKVRKLKKEQRKSAPSGAGSTGE